MTLSFYIHIDVSNASFFVQTAPPTFFPILFQILKYLAYFQGSIKYRIFIILLGWYKMCLRLSVFLSTLTSPMPLFLTTLRPPYYFLFILSTCHSPLCFSQPMYLDHAVHSRTLRAICSAQMSRFVVSTTNFLSL